MLGKALARFQRANSRGQCLGVKREAGDEALCEGGGFSLGVTDTVLSVGIMMPVNQAGEQDDAESATS